MFQYGILNAILFIIICFFSSVKAQEKYVITTIDINGNDKTKDYIIERELNFQVGDSASLQSFPILFKKGKRQLLVTGIIADAEFNLKNLSIDNKTVEIDIEVLERWPIYPIPIFGLADRNFNVWWTDYDHSLDRVNYGLKLYHLNLSGRNDQLMTKVQLGFSQKYEIKYFLPALKSLPDWGITGSILYALQKEMRYKTIDQRERFIMDEDKALLQRFRLEGGIQYRLGIYHRFRATLGYYQRVIAGKVLEFNQDYFLNGEKKQKFLKLSLDWTFDNRDNRAFTREGSFFSAELHRFGLQPSHSLNYWSGILTGHTAMSFNDNWTLQFSGKVRKQFTDEPLPYSERRAVNWENVFLEGYDYYLLDGQDYAYLKTGFYYRWLNTELSLGEWIPLESYEKLNIESFIGILMVSGYVQDPKENIGNYLANKLLYGAGPEVKIVVNNFVSGTFQIGVNHLGEVGYFLRASVAFKP